MELTSIISAFLLGFTGSFHCVGMCGPLMMSGIFRRADGIFSIYNWLIYHVGRLMVYAIWGLIFGLFGASVKFFGLQQEISLTLGIAIITVLIITKAFPKVEASLHETIFIKNIRRKITPFLHQTNPYAPFFGGILNGLLPCGLVYVALAGATAMQNIWYGAFFMIIFGLGNIPLLFLVLKLGQKFQKPFRMIFVKWYPALIAIMAVLLIVRGLNGGNFFSPSLVKGKIDTLHCAIH